MATKLVTSLVLVSFIINTFQNRCYLSYGESGTWKPLSSCPQEKEQFKRYILPMICGIYSCQPLVCCPDEQMRTLKYRTKSSLQCDLYTKLANNRLSFYVPDSCNKRTPQGYFAVCAAMSTFTTPKEYSHMAVLGYEIDYNIVWKCGGSLISDQFVLTAAHCLYADAPVKYVRLGDQNIFSNHDDATAQQYRVIQAIPYPAYVSSSKYHDIALLKLEKSISFTEYVHPACLQTDHNLENVTLHVTGWGAQSYASPFLGILQEIDIHAFAKEDCDAIYKPHPVMKHGILDKIQICAGSFISGKDACMGDSGGPLQIKGSPIRIVGVVSVGKVCGMVPGLYTRISAYIPWIVKTVWPD